MALITRFATRIACALAAASTLGLAACGGGAATAEADAIRAVTARADEAPMIGVNAYLWRAALEVVDLPRADTDPFGGTIETEWYVLPQFPNERFKLDIVIVDTRLRADGLNVTLHRQLFDADRGWLDAPSDPQTAFAIENSILSRARELKIAAEG